MECEPPENIETKDNDSFEVLKVDENEKDSSIEEDLLGAQSLLLSDSEPEDIDNEGNDLRSTSLPVDINENINEVYQNVTKTNITEDHSENEETSLRTIQKPVRKLLDSDEESEGSNSILTNKQEDHSENEESSLRTTQKPVRKLLDSDEESEGSNSILTNKQEDHSENEENSLRTTQKPVRKLHDSDEESEGSNSILANRQTVSQNEENKRVILSSDEESNNKSPSSPKVQISFKKIANRFSSIIDSDSEEDIPSSFDENSKDNGKGKKKKYSLDKFTKDPMDLANKNKKKDKSKSISNNEAAEIEVENEIDSDLQKKSNNKKAKFSQIVDTDESSQSSESGSEIEMKEQTHDENEDTGDINENVAGKTKKMRASAKKAIDDMQLIQSEQQRLHREAYISIPYHKPKKHTLEEFLKRRTIIKAPSATMDKSRSASFKHPPKSLRMTSEELEEYAKFMEERAKEATEFFKSESEDEDEPVMKDNPGVMDIPNLTESLDNIDIKQQMENESNAVPLESVETLVISETSDNQSAKEIQCNDISPLNVHQQNILTTQTSLPVQLDISPGKVLITEVLELPKVDLSASNIKIDDVSPKVSKTSDSLKEECSSPPVSKSRLKAKQVLETILSEKLHVSPTIKGEKDMLIDLESGELISKTPTGVDNLLQRLLATKKIKKEKPTDSVNIMSVYNGKIEISKVNLNVHNEEEGNLEHKPGAAYFKLQNNLKSLITKKRMELLKQKRAEEIKNQDEDEDDEEKEEELEEEDDDMEEYEANTKLNATEHIMVDEDENAFEVVEAEENNNDDDDEKEVNEEGIDEETVDKELKSRMEISEAEDTDAENVDEEDSSNDGDSSDDDIQHENEVASNNKKRSRILKAFQDDSDEDTNIDFFKTPKLNGSDLYIDGTQQQPGQGVLFEKEAKKSEAEEENELAALCSGQFDSAAAKESPLFITQIPITQPPTNQKMADEELLKLCSGSFDQDTQPDTQNFKANHLAAKGNKILSSDEEAHGDVDEAFNEKNSETIKSKIKKFTKRLKKGEMKLGFSDDEEEEEENDRSVETEAFEEIEETEDDQPETFVDYDSEENEIVVEMTKKDRLMKASNFFEKEAELSESEWGSADEDEKNLDNYDIELGDEDEFDREQLRDEIGKIHMRKMLDEDVREVRKLQEMFVEDEENDGVGRQRQFRWKNAETGFSLETNRKDEDDVDDNGDSGGEENEHIWRKIRFEREQLLKERMQKENPSTTILSSTSSTSNSPNITTRKINIITSKRNLVNKEPKKGSPFLISKTTHSVHTKSVRGSFLVRDKETLSKLAGQTKGSSSLSNPESTGTAGSVSVKSSIAKNFVFATLTEEEHETLKRKADDLINSSTENGINFVKKPKIEPRRDTCFIDQLL